MSSRPKPTQRPDGLTLLPGDADPALVLAFKVVTDAGFAIRLAGEREWTTPKEYAADLGVHVMTVSRRLKMAGCPPTETQRGESGRLVRLRPTDALDAWILEQAREPQVERDEQKPECRSREFAEGSPTSQGVPECQDSGNGEAPLSVEMRASAKNEDQLPGDGAAQPSPESGDGGGAVSPPASAPRAKKTAGASDSTDPAKCPSCGKRLELARGSKMWGCSGASCWFRESDEAHQRRGDFVPDAIFPPNQPR